MQCDDKIFAELFGFAIFDLQDLIKLKAGHQLNDDLLDTFTTSEIGDEVIRNGIIIPILGIIDDYYCVNILFDKNQQLNLFQEEIIVRSEG